jgi:hypothetical protein
MGNHVEDPTGQSCQDEDRSNLMATFNSSQIRIFIGGVQLAGLRASEMHFVEGHTATMKLVSRSLDDNLDVVTLHKIEAIRCAEGTPALDIHLEAPFLYL